MFVNLGLTAILLLYQQFINNWCFETKKEVNLFVDENRAGLSPHFLYQSTMITAHENSYECLQHNQKTFE